MTFTEYLQTEGYEDADDAMVKVGEEAMEKFYERYERQCKDVGEEAVYD